MRARRFRCHSRARQCAVALPVLRQTQLIRAAAHDEQAVEIEIRTGEEHLPLQGDEPFGDGLLPPF